MAIVERPGELKPTPAYQRSWIEGAFLGLEFLPIVAIASANIGHGIKLRIYVSREMTEGEIDEVDHAITAIHACASSNEQLPFADFEFVSHSQEIIKFDKEIGYTLVDFPEQIDAT